jgi:VWFA-related protein
MSRSRFTLAVAILGVAGVVSARQETQFRSANDSVPIYATVLSRDGHLVTDLTRDDFEVLDNGRPQPLTMFANGVQPITVVLMLDRSGSVELQFKLIEDAAAEFVRNLAPEDKVRIGSFSLWVQIDPETFTSNQDELFTILREKLLPIGPTPLWSAAATAMTALEGQTGRRVVLMFTDGHNAPLGNQPKVTFEDVRRRAEAEEIMVYGIGLVGDCESSRRDPVFNDSLFTSPFQLFQRRGGPGRGGQGRGGPTRMPPGGRVRLPMPPMPGRGGPPGGAPGRPPNIPDSRTSSSPRGGCVGAGPDPSLKALTEVGGGGYFELKRASDLATTFARVADELHHQYLMAFTAPSKDGTLHRLDVKVKRPDVTVRARRGYIAPK